jgi:hypothetical protein
MGLPAPLVIPDFARRAQALNLLEKALVTFIENLFVDAYRLDNPGVNALQASEPAHPIQPPDTEQVPWDPTGRAQTLQGKVPPQVVRGAVARTVTGEIDLNQVPNVPAINVQAIKARVANDETHVTVRIYVTAYDENPNQSGYQDVLNMIEAMVIALTSWGQMGIDGSYPIILPMEWQLLDNRTFPHFIGEMMTVWQLPSARPMPDPDQTLIPSESLEFHVEPQLVMGGGA